MAHDDGSDPGACVSPGLDQCAEMVSTLCFREVSGGPRIQAGGLAGSTARPGHPTASHLMCIKYDDDTRNWYSQSLLSLVFNTTEPVGHHCLTESFIQPYGKGISHSTSQVGN